MKIIKFLNKKSMGILKVLPFLVVFLIIRPSFAYGFVFDAPSNILAGLSEITGPVMATIILSYLLMLFGYILLNFSTYLLQGIISFSADYLTVSSGTPIGNIVNYGWTFVSQTVNLLLLIAFVVIALSIIMGSEKTTLKKSLPRLILVALFVNFSLLFVQIGIDFSNIIFNTISNLFPYSSASNPLLSSVEPLIASSAQWYQTLVVLIGGQILAMLVPFGNVVAQASWFLLFSRIIFEALFYGIITLLLSGVFFIYFFVFIIRIFIIQLLAIVAPLAFFCLIFDQTKKYWDSWLKNLIQWLLVGVVFIFVMYFGLLLAPVISDISSEILNSLNISVFYVIDFSFIFNFLGHIVLIVYFLTIISILKKFIPSAANALIAQGVSFMKTLSPYTSAIVKGGKAYSLKNRDKAIHREPLTSFGKEKIQPFQKSIYKATDRASTLIKGVTPDHEFRELMKQKKDKALERSGGSASEALKYIQAKGRLATSEDKYIASMLAQEDGKAMTELVKDKDLLGSVISEMSNRKDKNVIKMTPHLLGDDTAILSAAKLNQKDVVAKLRSDNFDVPGDDINKFIEDMEDKGKYEEVKNALEKATLSVSLSKMKTDDIKNLSSTVFESPNFNAALRESRGPQEIANILNGHDYEVTRRFEESIIKEIKNNIKGESTDRAQASIKRLLNTPASKSLLVEAESFSKQISDTKQKISKFKEGPLERRQAEIDASVRQGIEREEKKSKDLEAAKERVDSWKQKNTERMQADIDASVKREIERDAREKQQKDLDKQRRSASAKKGWETRDYNEYLNQAKKDHDQAAKEEKDRFDFR